MKILVACEYSGTVRDAFRKKGHDAWSCDILPTETNSQYHYQCDVTELLKQKWDMIIAFPPCTKTSNAGAKHLWRGHKLNIPRYYEGLCGKALFMAILNADCPRIAVENPVPSAIFDFPKPTQTIEPYYFGDPRHKKTLLWLKGLEPLVADNMVDPTSECHSAGTWFMKGGKERQRNRAKLSHEIARAMAEQWAGRAE